MNYCKTCKFRKRYLPLDYEHTCENPKLNIWTEKHSFEKDMLLFDCNIVGNYLVGEDFGCVHHEPK